MPSVSEIERLRQAFDDHADTMASRAPIWSQVSRRLAAAEDPSGLRSALLVAPPEQRRPVLALAALHDLVLRETGSPVARHLAAPGEHPMTVDDLWDGLVDLATRRVGELRNMLAARHTQTNEVGRCAVLMPALAAIAQDCGPLSVVELGASAGLLLNLDRYHYRYRTPRGDVVIDPDPSLVETPPRLDLVCGIRGDVDLPDRLPVLATRRGIDPHPIDVDDAEATRWLQACIWPDQTDRLETLRAALHLARRHPVTVVRGDAVELIPGELDSATTHPVVLSSWALTYVPANGRRRLWQHLDERGRQQDLSLVLFEDPALIPEVPIPHSAADGGLTVLTVVRWRSGERQILRRGAAHPHGYWWSPEA